MALTTQYRNPLAFDLDMNPEDPAETAPFRLPAWKKPKSASSMAIRPSNDSKTRYTG